MLSLELRRGNRGGGGGDGGGGNGSGVRGGEPLPLLSLELRRGGSGGGGGDGSGTSGGEDCTEASLPSTSAPEGAIYLLEFEYIGVRR
jgi:hypothetical protein